MKLKIKRTSKSKIILIFIVFLIFSIKFNFFYNTYLIIIKNLDFRLLSAYGDCYPMGYGFIKNIKKKYKKNTINYNIKNKKIYPTSSIFFYKPNFEKNKNLEILLNYNVDDLSKIEKKYRILEKSQDCYLIQYIND